MIKQNVSSLLMLLMVSCAPFDAREKAAINIHDIQGCAHLSPYDGKDVNKIQGIVTHKVSNGFTMQNLNPDEKACTSEGIFIFTGEYPSVLSGDFVEVDGRVDEYFSGSTEDFNLSQTEIIADEIHILQSDQPLPKPILLDEFSDLIPDKVVENDAMDKFDIQEDGLDFFESLESMLIEIDQAIVVAPKNEYNEIVLLPEAFIKLNILSKQGALLQTETDMNPEKMMVKLPSTYDDTVNTGNYLAAPIIGVLDYSYGNFKLLNVNPVSISSVQEVKNSWQPNINGLTIATYNLENLSQFDEGSKYKQIAKQIVDDLSLPDILVLNEVMDNSGTEDDGEVKADKTIEKLIGEIKKRSGVEYNF